MSTDAVAWVLEHSEARGLDRLVLISLAFHANHKTGACFPSMRTIAREAGVSLGKVAKSIHRLVEMGEVVIAKCGDQRRSTRYALPFLDLPSVHHVNAEFTPLVNAEFTPGVNGTTTNAKQPRADVVVDETWAEVVDLIQPRPREEVVQRALGECFDRIGREPTAVRALRAASPARGPGAQVRDVGGAHGADGGDRADGPTGDTPATGAGAR